jgi:co-chaperonin GroES (HSP10)
MIIAAGKRLVVKELVEQEVSKGGLILPNKRDQVRACVISAGTEVDREIKADDIVYLPPDTGIEIKIEGEDYLSIVENQILAVIRED